MTALVGDVREITMAEAPAVGEPVVSVDEGGGNERTRNLTGSIESIVRIVAICLSIYILLYVSTIFNYIGIQLFGAHRALVYGGVLFILFMMYPAGKNSPRDRVPWYDFALAAIGTSAALYACFSWENWQYEVNLLTTFEKFLGIALALITLEAARRVLGIAFALVITLFIVYPLVGPYLPASWSPSPIRFPRWFSSFIWPTAAAACLAPRWRYSPPRWRCSCCLADFSR
jgi:TRAP-type uncharacterized transport system fused permease subunit